MEKTQIELPSAYRLLNPGVVTLVTVGDGTEDNVFSAAWTMPMRKDPPLVGLLSGKRHHSYPFIARTGEFGLNVPSMELADAVLGCGGTDQTALQVPESAQVGPIV